MCASTFSVNAQPTNTVSEDSAQPDVLFPVASPQQPQSRLDYALTQPDALNSFRQLCVNATQALCFDVAVDRIYAANGYMPIWESLMLREALYTRLRTLDYAKLMPGMAERIMELEYLEAKQDQRGFDILATDSYLVYQVVMQQMTKRPSLLFRHQTLPQVNHQMLTALETHPVNAFLRIGANEDALMNSLRVNEAEFTVTQRSLLQARRYQDLAPHEYVPTPRLMVREGQLVPNGHKVIEILYQHGDLSEHDYDWLQHEAIITNRGAVHMALQRFQQRNGLHVDGIYGPATSRQLALPYEEVARLIALNLHRNQFGATGAERPSIRVNIPDYHMIITHKDEVVFESKVIVGRTARPTNLFSSALSVMVVNPRWNVPETIKKEDVIPGMKRSPDYLQRKNLTIINSWRDRTEIPADQIEWSTVDPETFPYEFMQGPGPTNALGNVKFLMPNDYSIYLHDTPARGLFNRTKRNLSSGCVRVEKAAELADYILDYQRRSQSYRHFVKTDEIDNINLPRKIDVDFTYVTAWVDENDVLQMREDIYGYDRPIREPVEEKFSTLKNYRRY
ncbi:L,D-transpeptidase family protein [Photobacterium aphoticum]|uniref:L,D-transpeptidase family protein n=1 Tax=Photobacterium aphoticum TaxID=754436 RepID=UPI001304E8DC|nr:L,D-transpeptidase family protein [Photobacterium aphoticum]